VKVTLFSEKHIKIFFKKFLTYHQNALLMVMLSAHMKTCVGFSAGLLRRTQKPFIRGIMPAVLCGHYTIYSGAMTVKMANLAIVCQLTIIDK
ncbi:hypothetical protein, partial [[Clostridium] symbiosum]|uniref:hypothetical protein n=1 Tax=Clostridium symbiosum TaxID=1512 RepID=UPI001A9A7753